MTICEADGTNELADREVAERHASQALAKSRFKWQSALADDSLGRSAHLGGALLEATARRPAAPLKLNLCLTYWCQYRCKTCNIWQRKPSDELTTDEVIALVRENPNVTWVDLTGGEIFLRPDIDDIFEAVVIRLAASRASCTFRPTDF